MVLVTEKVLQPGTDPLKVLLESEPVRPTISPPGLIIHTLGFSVIEDADPYAPVMENSPGPNPPGSLAADRRRKPR